MKNKIKPFKFTSGTFALLLIFMVSCATQQGIGESSASETDNTTEQSVNGSSDRSQLNILFLGDDGHHQPRERSQQVIPYFSERGIQLHYTEQQEDLNAENLKRYDSVMMYGNRYGITPRQEKDLLTYINNGGGF